MIINDKHLENIIQASDEDSLAIFVGAGVSKSSESENIKLPSWSDLIDELKLDLGIHYEIDYLKVAQLYYLEFGSHIYFKKIKKYFPDNVTPSKLHDLIFNINPHCVITTNWDCLLDTAVIENAYIYDIVCSDKDLMKSSLDKKLIKMHGDFKNHNIVFKEDDYINYDANFPLVSNYIKSVLSTHTVIFIGYSYNDIDIKQVIKWAQNHSTVRPPMYLVVYEDDYAQRKYLASHGITTIKVSSYQTEFFTDKRSSSLYGFLKSIKEKRVSNNEDKNIIKHVYTKLQELNSLNAILAEQITECLGDSTLLFREVNGEIMAFLKFYNSEVTQKTDKGMRYVYKRFKDVLKDNEESKKYNILLTPIFDILWKADISGVIIDDKDSEAILTTDFVPESKKLSDKEIFTFEYNFDFDFSKKNHTGKSVDFDNCDVYAFFQIGNYEMAYHAIENVIKHDLKHKNYASLLISLLNYNMILHVLKYRLGRNSNRFLDTESYNLKERFDSFPKNVKRTLSSLLDIVTVDYMFKFIYSVDKILTKNKDREGRKPLLYWDADEFKSDFLHKNILHFIKLNGCLIDSYSEFKYAISKLFEIKSVKRKSQENNETIYYTIEELYSSIKYLDNKELSEKFRYKKRGKYLTLQLDTESSDWLLNHAFEEMYCGYMKKASNSDFNLNAFKNVILLLAFSDEPHKDKSPLHKKITSLVENGFFYSDLIECISDYVTICFNNKRDGFDKSFVAELMNSMIKLSTSTIENENDHGYLILRKAHNIFLIASELSVEFNDINHLKELISSISELPVTRQASYIESLLYDLFIVGDDKIKCDIKEYVKNMGIEKLDYEKKNRLKLFLVASNIIEKEEGLEHEILEMIRKLPANKFSTELYSIRSMLDFLVRNGEDSFTVALEELKETIAKLEKKFFN